jgi:hypothetical protein
MVASLTALATWAYTSFPPVSYAWLLGARLFLAYHTAPWYYVQAILQALLPRSLYVRLTAQASANKLRSQRFLANALRKKPGVQMHRRKTLPWM